MRKIIKRLIKRDFLGKVHLRTVQELIDDEHGNIAELTENTYSRCNSCSKVVENIGELFDCDRCGISCCEHCTASCTVCSKRICATCRHGFGENKLTVCPECFSILKDRQEYLDKIDSQKLNFNRHLEVYREQVHIAQNGLFSRSLCGDLLRQLADLKLIRKLCDLEKLIDKK